MPNSGCLRKNWRYSSRTPESCWAPSLFLPLLHPWVKVPGNLESFRLSGSQAHGRSSQAFLVCWGGLWPCFGGSSGEQSLIWESEVSAVWILSTWVLPRGGDSVMAASGNCVVRERFFFNFFKKDMATQWGASTLEASGRVGQKNQLLSLDLILFPLPKGGRL